MNEKIPIHFGAVLKPEWIDYALEQFVNSKDEKELSVILSNYLEVEISSATTMRKTLKQLQRTVGYLSVISKEKLSICYNEMVKLSPSQRNEYRFILLVESNPFLKDVVLVINKLSDLGIDGIGASDLYMRIISKYGDRGSIPRRVRCVLQTLLNFMVLENKNRKWYVKDCALFLLLNNHDYYYVSC